MKPVDAHPELGDMLRTLRIIVLGIASGLLLFLAYVVWAHYGQTAKPEASDGTRLTYVGLAAALISTLVFALVRSALLRAARKVFKSGDIESFRQKYTAAVILGVAGIEGPGFLLCVAFLLEGQLMALVGAVLCLLLILLALPSPTRLNHLLELAR